MVDKKYVNYSDLHKKLSSLSDFHRKHATVFLSEDRQTRIEEAAGQRYFVKNQHEWVEFNGKNVTRKYIEFNRSRFGYHLRDPNGAKVKFLGKNVTVPRIVFLPHGSKYVEKFRLTKFSQYKPIEEEYFSVRRSSTRELPCRPNDLMSPITNSQVTFVRDGFGRFGASRGGGASRHTGVDIIPAQSFQDPETYAVKSIARGIVAYSRVNGTLTEGFGNTIVIDHGNNCYSLYAHLASAPFTPMKTGDNLLKKVGDRVGRGERIGYFVDIKADVSSTGNATRTHPAARHQVHFELIRAPSGRQGSGSLGASILRSGAVRTNPEVILLELGYKIQ